MGAARRINRSLWLVYVALIAVGCSADEVAQQTPEIVTDALEVLRVSNAGFVVEGSPIVVDTRGLTLTGPTPTLRLMGPDFDFSLDQDGSDGERRRFLLSRDAANRLADETTTVTAVLVQGESQSAPYPHALTVQSKLALGLASVPSGSWHRESEVSLRGAGFLGPTEGESLALLSGVLSTSAGSVAVDASLPLSLVGLLDRTHGQLRLTTDLGGVASGSFSGGISLQTTTLGGVVNTSESTAVSFTIPPPSLFEVGGAGVALGELAPVLGAGLIGLSDRPDEVTLLRFEGILIDDSDDAELFVGEAVIEGVTSNGGEFPIRFESDGIRLTSSFFGLESGRFEGTVTPIVLRGQDSDAGLPLSVKLRLRGVRQVVLVTFLSGFGDSLRRFGLGLGETQVRAAVLERLRSIYADWEVEFVTTAPSNVMEGAYATVEIGGSDPNGFGAFGYDNTPGKDVWNLRLGDRIGGANADVQFDGQPGYGGVFIESYLWWSAHPELPGGRPAGAPEPDPLFDQIFDPTRAEEATLAELQGGGDGARAAVVERAVSALAAIAGETAAHEFGHSLGLAEPWAGPMVFHRYTPGEGCLMDSGGERPLGERAGQPGFSATRMCGTELDYLTEILPRF